MTAVEQSTGKRSALAKAMAVLESLLSHTRLSDIAQDTNLPMATVHRILSELVDGGWVHQSSSKEYFPGQRLYATAGSLQEDSHIVAIATPQLEWLRERTGFGVSLGLHRRDAIMCVAEVDGKGVYRMHSRLGALLPLYSTAIGKSVLATFDDDYTRALVDRHRLKPFTSRTRTELQPLLEDVRATRNRGWAFDEGEHEPTVNSVGAAITAARGKVIGALAVSALDFELDLTSAPNVAKAVQRAAGKISESLGAP